LIAKDEGDENLNIIDEKTRVYIEIDGASEVGRKLSES
jgi:hypothetical protein